MTNEKQYIEGWKQVYHIKVRYIAGGVMWSFGQGQTLF